MDFPKELLEGNEKQLDKSDTVKIRISRSALKGEQTKRIASKAAEQTKALFVETRGQTFTLYKDSE
jgi:RNA-binding protein YhbY